MSPREIFSTLARLTRQLGSGLVLIVCVRFAWLSASEANANRATAARDAGVGTSSSTERGVRRKKRDVGEESVLHPTNRRPDLEKLKELLSGETPSDEETQEDRTPHLTQRRLIVDFGPERSAVYVNGRKVGEVPYVGLVTCRDGDLVKVQVLPPKGVPLVRRPPCGDLVPSGARTTGANKK